VLKTRLLHPEMLRALGSAGHGSRVLVADGNYPFATEAPPGAVRVFLNLRGGLVTVIDVLEVLVETIPIESALGLERADGQPVALHETFRSILSASVPFAARKRQDFYAEARGPATTLVIATGEKRRFANLLLTIGVVNDEAI
jgi:L-fucose mutarotase